MTAISQLPGQVIQVDEIVFIEASQPARLPGQPHHRQGLEDLLDFDHCRVDRPVRKDQSIDTEIHVVDFIFEITTIRPVFFPLVLKFNRPRNPIPDKATLQAVIGFNRLPIVYQVAERIAHCVRIFAHDEG